MYQLRFRRLWRPSLSVTSDALIAFGRSYKREIQLNLSWLEYLFVGKDKKNSVAQFIFVQHSHQFLPSFSDTFAIVAVHNKDQTLCILEVITPQRSNFILTTNIPDSERNVLIFNCFNVESWNQNQGIMLKTKGYQWLEWLLRFHPT